MDGEFDQSKVAQNLVKDLYLTAVDYESWALIHTKPGLLVEQRFTTPPNFGPDSAERADFMAAFEMKIFVIWGRVYLAYLKRGSGRYGGLAYRNGTMIECQNTLLDWREIPDYLHYDEVVEVAEHLARNKDMFRVDIFIGIPSNGDDTRPRIVISETEFHPTTEFRDPEILEEAARLWMAGYYMNIYKQIPNNEVPSTFTNKQYLNEEDAARLALQSKRWTKALTWEQ